MAACYLLLLLPVLPFLLVYVALRKVASLLAGDSGRREPRFGAGSA